jgi:outer membrane protein assembly factor BamB
MKKLIFALSLISLCSVFIQKNVMAQDGQWTQFRGSNLDAVSTDNQVPVTWNDSTNIIWKTAIKGRGWSSPVVYNDQVWITTATLDGKEMSGVCVDFKTGKILYDLLLFTTDKPSQKHDMNSYATPTSCIEKGFVYMSFGSSGTACINTADGKVVWKRDDFKCDHAQGPGASLLLYKDFLIVDFEGTESQYIVALNKKTGELVWRADRPKECYEHLQPIGKKAYITPIVMNVGGRDLLISNGSAVCNAFDIQTGKEVWRVIEGEDSSVSMPFTENGIVYFYTGFWTTADSEKFTDLFAVDPSGSGDVTHSKVLWKLKSPPFQLLTPVIKDGLIYTVDGLNTLNVIDAKTGTSVYKKRLKTKYNSSPVYAAGRIYFTSDKGETLVLKAGKVLEVVAENKLPGKVLATPAICQHSIVMRTDKFLYRIGNK